MLTVDFDRLRLRAGDRLLDVGCGGGRHAVEAARRGAWALALDRSAAELSAVRKTEAVTLEFGMPLPGGPVRGVQGDATRLPFADGSFDRIIASEVLEHLPDDGAAIAELVRVLRPGGSLAVTVPRRLPERICWALSDAYHTTPGGHVRIYRGDRLRAALTAGGLHHRGRHHAHALHTPYWWLRCALGDEQRLAVRLYHRFLIWDLFRRPRVTRLLERLLNPLLGKSLVLYCDRPAAAATTPAAGELRRGAVDVVAA